MEPHGPDLASKIGPWILPKPLEVTSPAATPSERASPTEETKRRRAGGPKARTGCATCKTRHVKCDERKPTCFRCEKVGVMCEGYVDRVDRRRRKQTQNVVRRTTPLPIAPRSSPSKIDSCNSELIVSTTSQIPRSLSSLPEIYRKDGIYFDYFRHQVSTNLAGYYTSPNWSYLVVGEGLQDDCIHHSILAVGALIRSSPQDTKPSLLRRKVLPPSSDGQGVTEHREVALRHHLKAVKSLRERMELITASSPTTVVITTLLLVVYELLQGEPKTAELLLNSCLGVLKDCITMFESDSGNNETQPRDSEFDDMEHVLPCIAAMSHVSQSLQPLRRHTHPFKIDPGSDFHNPEYDSISKFFISWGRFFTFGVSFVGNSADAAAEGVTLDTLRLLTIHQHNFLSHLQRWKTIIQYYVQSPKIDIGTKKGMRIVQIHWLLLYITLTCCLDPAELAYDAFEDEFRDLTIQCVDLYRDCVSQPRPTSVLLGQGLILPLCTVVRACRNHDVRMTALQALHEIPSSMVPWDVVSKMDGILGALLLEETGRDENGYVPPESRWFWLKDVSVQETGRVHKVYQRLSPGHDGKPVLTKLRPTSNMRSKICKTGGCNKEHVLGPVVVEDF
ncbi:C6 zinc finger domain-containing protein [Colletotrichum tofieldiae]|uniref:C6 zinc finger domain-containing protein n=1 Tax=Colletotrichum tofieldiae TaxID=708197 RepID=A0A166R352_9PEZI|nr:C6 zinc finger domain-containing protein [Colletotrichum tofieldiae]